MATMPKVACDCTPDDLRRAEQQLEVARAALARRRKAMTFAIYKTVFIPTTTIPTMAMTERGVCLWNPKFILGRSKNRDIQTALSHELWHGLRRHAARGKALQKLDPSVSHAELNAAADREINDDEFAAGESFGDDLDPHVLVPSQINAADGLTMEDYIYAAREHQKQQQQQQQQQQEDDDEQDDGKQDAGGDDSGSAGSGDEVDDGDGDGDGQDGSGGAGDADDDGAGADGGAGGRDAGPAGDSVGCGKCGGAAGCPSDVEAEVDAAVGRNDEAIENMRQQVAQAIIEEAKQGRGDYPADLVRWAESIVAPAKVPWQQLLAALIRGAVSNRAGAGGVSYQHLARRMAGVGYGNGKPVLPAMRLAQPEVQAWVDTSGSVGTKELSAALAEIEVILKTLPGKVTVGACDAKVHALKKVASFSQVMPLMKGGGGTDFRPLFDAADKSKPRPDIVVVLTDGAATFPARPPEGMTVIFVLMGRWKVQPDSLPWGRCVVVDDDDK
jgi:predicted metal-dependent peptidase